MSSILGEWWSTERARGLSEREAVREIAARLGESEVETRGLLERLGGVTFPKSERVRHRQPNSYPLRRDRKNGRPSQNRSKLAAESVRRAYEHRRKSGFDQRTAARVVARDANCSAEDVRVITTDIDHDLEGSSA
jgi:hypothetical protein